MADDNREWRPGSFTKNFSWGPPKNGLGVLHEMIRAGFGAEVKNVPRSLFKQRVGEFGRSELMPLNFFLYNEIQDGENFVIADELVFQAINFEHSANFDKLAVFALNLSLAGRWIGSDDYQSYPALWANYYISDHVGDYHHWDTSKISADDIYTYVKGDSRFRAQDARKLSTNLNYLYRVGHISEMPSKKVDRWWINAFFLTLDRKLRDDERLGLSAKRPLNAAIAARFNELSGPRSVEKDLALQHLGSLFDACGGRDRFSEQSVIELRQAVVDDLQHYLSNDPMPVEALHPSNPKIVKSIPRACALLAKHVGFLIFEVEELASLSIVELVRSSLQSTLESLRKRGISPKVSAEELITLMRDNDNVR